MTSGASLKFSTLFAAGLVASKFNDLGQTERVEDFRKAPLVEYAAKKFALRSFPKPTNRLDRTCFTKSLLSDVVNIFVSS